MIYTEKVYQVMNKDVVVLECKITFARLRDTQLISDTKTEILRADLIPFGYSSLEEWVSHRLVATQRMDVVRLFNILGVKDTFEFIEVFHAVSVNDTFWIRVKTEKPIMWKEVSPYTNELDERIRYYAFTQTWDARLHASRVTPEYTTGGTFPKCWQRKNNQLYLCKYGTSGCVNSGLEPYSEAYACQVLKALGITHYTQYALHTHNNRVYAKCELITNEQIGMVSVEQLLRTANVAVKNYTDVYNWLAQQHLSNLQEDFSEMMLLDSLTLNVDRHMGNISVLFDNVTLKLLRLAPIYDNNLALIPYWYETNETVEAYLERHIKDNSLVSKLGTDFVELGKTFLTNNLRKKLIAMYDFEFERIGTYNLPASRLRALSKVVRQQATKILM